MYKLFKKSDKIAFTLIELMIVISIMGLLLLFSYAPYTFYQSKAKLRLATREVAQSFYETKNFSISGIKIRSTRENKSVWLLLSSKENQNNFVKYYLFDHDIFDKEKKFFDLKKLNFDDNPWTWNLLKTKTIQPDIFIKWFSAWDDKEKIDWDILVFYEVSSWNVRVFKINWNEKIELSLEKLKIDFSYKNSTTDMLNREITYYLKTNIVDYK